MMTWTCHVCGRERPDDKISVWSSSTADPLTGIKMTQNVRYCNDNQECIEAVKRFSFFDHREFE